MKFAYEVDPQDDFMNEGNGRLYVAGAEEIKPTIATIVDNVVNAEVRRVRTRDRHFSGNPEFEVNGGPFGFHCMDRLYGQKNEDGRYGIEFIPELKAGAATVVEHELPFNRGFASYTDEQIKQFATQTTDLVFDKQHYDVFTNPNAEAVLKEMVKEGFDEALVYGVATNVCVLAAVEGLQQRGIQTYVVADAIAGVPDEYAPTANAEAMARMEKAGAKFLTSGFVPELLK